MGVNMSFMGEKGLSPSQMFSLIINTLYKQFVEKDVNDFDAFNVAILDTFNTINMALPGKHYDAPSHKDVMDFFKQWKETEEEAKKKIFTDFMNKNVNLNKVDGSMIITAIVAPPAAMVAKRTGETVPQLKLMKAIPDVVFVPSATVLALITVKILRVMFMGKKASRDAKGSHMDHVVQRSNSNDIPLPPPAQQPEPATAHEPQPAPAQLQQSESETAPAPEPAASQQPAPAPAQQPAPPQPQQPEPEPEPEPAQQPAPPQPDPQQLEPEPAPQPAPEQPQQPEHAPPEPHQHTDPQKGEFYCEMCKSYHMRTTPTHAPAKGRILL